MTGHGTVTDGALAVPATLAECLKPDTLAKLEARLSPPQAVRATRRVEAEVEVVGEGTFALVLEGGRLSGKKGFAQQPLVSARVPKGGFGLVQRVLQEAVDGFVRAPELARRQREGLALLKPGDADAIVIAIGKLRDAAVVAEVAGVGAFEVAVGPVDEATRALRLTIDRATIDALLGGADLHTVRVGMGGDRGVLTAALAALGPLARLLQP